MLSNNPSENTILNDFSEEGETALLTQHVMPNVAIVPLFNLGDVNRKFRKLFYESIGTGDAYRGLCDRYFGWLKTVYPNDYAQDPEMLFKKTCEHFKNLYSDDQDNSNKLNMREMLCALDGDTSFLNKANPKKPKKSHDIYFAIMLGCGHDVLTHRFYTERKKYKSNTVEAEKGQTSLTTLAYKTACFMGNLRTYARLQKIAPYFEWFAIAATNNQHEMASHVFETPMFHFSYSPMSFIGKAIEALIAKYPETVQYTDDQLNAFKTIVQFLGSFNAKNAIPYLMCMPNVNALLAHAIKLNHAEVVEYLANTHAELSRRFNTEDYDGKIMLGIDLGLLQAANSNNAVLFKILIRVDHPQRIAHYLEHWFKLTCNGRTDSFEIMQFLLEQGFKIPDDKTAFLEPLILKCVQSLKPYMLQYLLHLEPAHRRQHPIQRFNLAEKMLQAIPNLSAHYKKTETKKLLEFFLLFYFGRSARGRLIFHLCYSFKSFEQMFECFDSLFDPNGKPYTKNLHFMFELVLVLCSSKLECLNNEFVRNFVLGLSDENYSTLKIFIKFYNYGFALEFFDKLRPKQALAVDAMEMANTPPLVLDEEEAEEPQAKRQRIDF